jgi:hypothetical protein
MWSVVLRDLVLSDTKAARFCRSAFTARHDGEGQGPLQHIRHAGADEGHGRRGGDDVRLTDEFCHGGASLSRFNAAQRRIEDSVPHATRRNDFRHFDACRSSARIACVMLRHCSELFVNCLKLSFFSNLSSSFLTHALKTVVKVPRSGVELPY